MDVDTLLLYAGRMALCRVAVATSIAIPKVVAHIERATTSALVISKPKRPARGLPSTKATSSAPETRPPQQLANLSNRRRLVGILHSSVFGGGDSLSRLGRDVLAGDANGSSSSQAT